MACIGLRTGLQGESAASLSFAPQIRFDHSQSGEYDPFTKVQTSDSLGSTVRIAINKVSKRILLVWQEGFEDPDIYAQLYDLTFSAIGPNIKVNPAGNRAAQIAPDVCALADGNFLVCWEDYTSTTPNIMAQGVNQNGSLHGSSVKVSPMATTAQFFPKVESNGDSTHVIWLQKDGQDYNVYIRTLSLQVVPRAPAVRVNDDDNGLQWAPEIASFGYGQTVVVWEDKRDGHSEIYAQIYKADGVKRGDNFVVNSDAMNSLQWRPAVAGNESMAQVVWEDYQNRAAAIYAQQLDSYGLLSGENQRLDQSALLAAKEKPALCVEEQGQRVFAWQEKSEVAWRLKFAVFPVASDVPTYYMLGENDTAHEFTNIQLGQIKNAIYFAFLGEPIGGKSTVLAHKVTLMSVPVELMHFQAAAIASGVHLTWQTASETSNLGFAVERMRETGDYAQAAFIQGMGTTSSQHYYEYVDDGLRPGKYRYRLRQIDLDGTSTVSDEIEITVSGPEHFELLEAYPNPFETRTHLLLRLPVASEVEAWVYNLLGQRVCRLVAGSLPSGQNELDWDGRDERGLPVPAGVYLLQARINGKMQIRSVALVR
ncbi:MAG TPA: FlgD immunoglobulin-like domain containing protein [bacterium]|nr:FlgD immunoglobulin-like domain containing protein [bacterium]HQG44463.1 FlgD immunoglobulin-like domain containing protein [bacterium]HQJ63761.1 FlgD immunoglobulin-like domain containing protein [bacterium]